ncbi:MAG: flagellar hook-length control protein FliK, partial [Spirochaetota bacterium]
RLFDAGFVSMQALQASGQATEVRDPLPVRGPATGEAENSEHPFMKLLTSLRNAMKEGSESGQDTLIPGSRLESRLLSRGKFLSRSVGPSGARMDGAEEGLQLDSGLAAMNESRARLLQARQQARQGFHGLDLTSTNGKPLSAIRIRGDKADATQAGDAKARATKVGATIAGDATLGASPGRGRGTAQNAVDGHDSVRLDKENQPGLDNKKQKSVLMRSKDRAAEIMAKHKRTGLQGSMEGAMVAASGGLNRAADTSGLNRNRIQGDHRGGAGQAALVGESREAGRRPSRYSVVDLRLKASAQKSRTVGQPEGKPAGEPAGSAPTDMNRNGLSGTDAAGRQIGNDPTAGGFTEVSKGTGTVGSDKAPAGFAENLAARLRDGGSMDIVRSAQIVLKDGDAGLIRLRLEPESLGGVKIELKMADKQISARIIVESDLAGEAFRSSLDSLRDAFASSGFETTSIEVEVRDGRAGSGGPGRDNTGNDEDGDDKDPYMARKAGKLGAAVPEADATSGRYGVIDLVV